MTIDINEMRKDKRPQSSTVVHALLDRLEAAEKERDFAKVEIARLHDDIHELTDERDALRAKIERMDKIESAAQNLVKMKGRRNTEIAYQRLVAALEKTQ